MKIRSISTGVALSAGTMGLLFSVWAGSGVAQIYGCAPGEARLFFSMSAPAVCGVPLETCTPLIPSDNAYRCFTPADQYTPQHTVTVSRITTTSPSQSTTATTTVYSAQSPAIQNNITNDERSIRYDQYNNWNPIPSVDATRWNTIPSVVDVSDDWHPMVSQFSNEDAARWPTIHSLANQGSYSSPSPVMHFSDEQWRPFDRSQWSSAYSSYSSAYSSYSSAISSYRSSYGAVCPKIERPPMGPGCVFSCWERDANNCTVCKQICPTTVSSSSSSAYPPPYNPTGTCQDLSHPPAGCSFTNCRILNAYGSCPVCDVMCTDQ